MTSSVQENEMYLASQYCQKYIAELTDLLVSESMVLNIEIKNCESKISSELNDVEQLKGKINLCKAYLSDNTNRLHQIQRDIHDLEDDISLCEYKIDTTSNRIYIEQMRERICDDKHTIKGLRSEARYCESNIASLYYMISEIDTCIRKKEDLISKLKTDISLLQKSFASLKNEIGREQSELKLLDGKIIKGAEFIHNYGITMARINYHGMSVPYSNNDIFSITSTGLAQEIDLLNSVIKVNSVNISNCGKGMFQYSAQLQDNVSEQAKQITVKCITEIKKINDMYISAMDTMKKALSFLSAYENIRI